MRCAGHELALLPFADGVSRIAFLLFVAIVLAACAPAAVEVPLPSPSSNIVTSVPPSTSLPTQGAQIPEQRLLVLEWPEKIRVGDSDLILLTLEIDREGNITPTASIQGHQVQGENITIPNLYESHFVFAEGRLDISGLEIKPNPEIIEPLLPNRSVKFAWSVRPVQVGNYRGMIWLHLIFKPKNGGAEERLVLSAQRIDIHAVDLLGLSGNAARWMGALGTFFGSLMSFDPIAALFGKLWKRKQKRNHPTDEEQ